jgi:hypothetical protein
VEIRYEDVDWNELMMGANGRLGVNSNEPSVSVYIGEILDYLRDYHILKNIMYSKASRVPSLKY